VMREGFGPNFPGCMKGPCLQSALQSDSRSDLQCQYATSANDGFTPNVSVAGRDLQSPQRRRRYARSMVHTLQPPQGTRESASEAVRE